DMNERKRLRVAMIGCGGLARGVLLPALTLVDELRLVATCDLRRDAAVDAADRFRAERAYTDYSELLAAEDLDGVLMAAPPAIHTEAGIVALERGLHVYTEKPPSMTAAGAKRFRDAARGTTAKVLMGTVQRHCPVNRMAKEIISRPGFGEPIVYQARYLCPGPGMRMDWGLDRDSDADMFRFFLLDHIIHHLDLTRFFMGDIAAVSAMRSQTNSEQYAGVIQYRFGSGIVGSQTIAFRSPVFENRTLIAGDGPAWVETHNWSKLTYSIPDLPVGTGGYNDGRIITWDGGIGYQNGVIRPGYREEITAWARAILDGTECRADLDDGYREMLLIDAIIESLRTGGEVTLAYD
ncbi:Gfo/Idh/MocA family oxidoreductase, partial [Candidatus Poribacteria bacterium]|nr:Gfo/Idh/MocA family oxidoreductase [Candidatus Poribacteria bacterium]